MTPSRCAGGRVYVNGKPLSEPWLPNPAPVTSPSPLPEAFSLNHPFTVPAGGVLRHGGQPDRLGGQPVLRPDPAATSSSGKMAFVAWPLTDGTWIAVLSVLGVVVLVALVLVLQEPGPARSPARPRRGPGEALAPAV